jgi:hypothetical protein
MKGPIVANQRTAVIAGLTMILVGTWLVYDAYEGRGKIRPLLMRALTVA